jgi:hypothetical protein
MAKENSSAGLRGACRLRVMVISKLIVIGIDKLLKIGLKREKLMNNCDVSA